MPAPNVSGDDLARLRRMVDEPTSAAYSDAILEKYCQRRATIDERGTEPYTWDAATAPPTQEWQASWIPTWDLNAAAADVWEEKAAALAEGFDFQGGGQSFEVSQEHAKAMAQARLYRSRSAPRSVSAGSYPRQRESDRVWIGNLPEVDED